MSGIHRIEFAEVRVAVFKDRAMGACVRRAAHRQISAGAAGDAELAALLRDAAADLKRLGKDPGTVPGIIDAVADAPWQVIVGIVYAFRGAGFEQVQFASSRGPK